MSDAGSDFVQRFLFEDLDVSGMMVRLSRAWQQMQSRRDYSATVRNRLGELAAVTVLIGSNLKQPGRVSVQLRGNGPLSLLLVECTRDLHLRGMARAEGVTASLRLPELFADGQLTLTMQDDGGRSVYQSIVPLDGETVAEVFEHYLSQSVQHPASLMLAADRENAVGLLLQKLPCADLRDSDGWARVMQLAATVTARELAVVPTVDLLPRVFPQESIRLFDPKPAQYHCPEDRDKVRNMLRTLGREEVIAILREHGEVVIHDEVCNHDYRFDADEIAALFPPTPPSSLH